jgi:hypothetical protein
MRTLANHDKLTLCGGIPSKVPNSSKLQKNKVENQKKKKLVQKLQET